MDMRRLSGGTAPFAVERTAPSMDMEPSLGRMNPAIMRKVVVLPQPEGPSSEMNSPAASDRSTPDTAEVSPKRLPRPLSCSFATGSPSPQHEVAADQAEAQRHQDDGGDEQDAAQRREIFEIALAAQIVQHHRHHLSVGRGEEDGGTQLARRRDEDEDPGGDDALAQQRRDDAGKRGEPAAADDARRVLHFRVEAAHGSLAAGIGDRQEARGEGKDDEQGGAV